MLDLLLNEPYFNDEFFSFIGSKENNVVYRDITVSVTQITRIINTCFMRKRVGFKIYLKDSKKVWSEQEILEYLRSNINEVENLLIEYCRSKKGILTGLSREEKLEYIGLPNYMNDRDITRLLVRYEELHKYKITNWTKKETL